MESTTNFEKHTVANPVSKFFLNNFLTTLTSQLKSLSFTSILDVGAGEGFTLKYLQERKIGKKLEGIEYMDEAIAIGKKLHPTVVIKKGDIYKLPYGVNSFDVVLCTEVLEHLEEPGEAVKELVRVTKKYVIFSVPNEPWFTVQRFFRGKNILKLGDHPEHIQHWTSGRFVQFIEKYGTIVAVKHPVPWTMIVLEKRA